MPSVVDTTGEPVGELELAPGSLELDPEPTPCCDGCAGGKPCRKSGAASRAATVLVAGGMLASTAALGAHVAGRDHRVVGAMGGVGIGALAQQLLMQAGKSDHTARGSEMRGVMDHAQKVLAVGQTAIAAGAAIGAAAAPESRALGAAVGAGVITAALAAWAATGQAQR